MSVAAFNGNPDILTTVDRTLSKYCSAPSTTYSHQASLPLPLRYRIRSQGAMPLSMPAKTHLRATPVSPLASQKSRHTPKIGAALRPNGAKTRAAPPNY